MSAGPRAVLWDLDGTLIDTEPYWMAAEYELAAEFSRVWTEADARSVIGFDLLDAAAVFIARTGVPLSAEEIVDRLLQSVIERLRRAVPWRPGALELLTGLRRGGMPCGLVTMSYCNLAQEILTQLPAGSFNAVVTGDMVDNGKPHPEPYRRAAEALGIDPGDCVAIEDSPTGVASAEAAGCKVVAVPNLVAIEPAPNRIVIGSLTDLSAEDFLPARSAVAAAPVPGRPPTPVPGRPPAPALFDGELDPDGAELDEIDFSDQPAGGSRRWRRRRDDDFGFVVEGHQRGTRASAPIGRRGLLAAAAIVLLIAGLVVWQWRTGDREPAKPLALNVHTWAPYWTLDDSLGELGERAGQFHELSPFWYSAVGVDQIVVNEHANADEVEQFMSSARDRGATVIPSIIDDNEAGVMAALIADPAQRTRHVEAIAKFAADGDFPGVDIDYERFAFSDDRSTWEATRPNWVAFVEELADRLHADGRTLTVTVPPIYDGGRSSNSGYWVYDPGAIGDSVDVLRVMAYDYSTSDPGPIAPIDWVRTIVAAMKDAVDDDSKIVLGVPMYGYNWPIGTSGTCPEDDPPSRTSVSTRGIPDLLARRNARPAYNEQTAEASFTYTMELTDGTNTCTVTRQVNFVDAQGVEARIRLALDERLGGVALWAFGNDDASIWSVIDQIDAELTPTTTSSN